MKNEKRPQKDKKRTPNKGNNPKLKSSGRCIRISPTQQSTKSTDCDSLAHSQSTSRKKLSLDTVPKNLDGYDEDFEHSKEIHKQDCKTHQKRWFATLRNRVFKTTDLKDFEALLGMGDIRADFMPASDLKARNMMGRFLIDEMENLYELGVKNAALDFQWITIVSDHLMLNEREGVAKIYACKKAVQDVLRNYTDYSALGVVETQPIINYPIDQRGKMFSVHAHVFCWGAKSQTAKLKRHSKRFKSSITKLPVHSLTAYHFEGSFGRLGRYMAKPPFEGKEVNFEKLALGKACLSTAKRVEKYHDFRLFETNAKMPLESTLFGVRDGANARMRIAKKLQKWHRDRKGTVFELATRVDRLFEDFLRDNKKLKNYKPLVVKYKKGQ